MLIIVFAVGLRPASSRCCSILATTAGVGVFVPSSFRWCVSLATSGGVSAFANSISNSRKHVQISLVTRVLGVPVALMKLILVIPFVGKGVPLPLLDPLIRPCPIQQRRSRLAPTEV